MNFISKYIYSLKKKDTILAFFVASFLYYHDTKNIISSIVYAIKFVLIFLFFLTIFFK
jgi:hypothetical protein